MHHIFQSLTHRSHTESRGLGKLAFRRKLLSGLPFPIDELIHNRLLKTIIGR